MGLVALATAARAEFPELEIILYDFRYPQLPLQSLFDRNTLVGVYSTVRSHRFALREVIAPAAIAGATVIMGGPYPTVRWKQILQNRPEITYVVRQHGEQALIQVLLNDPAPSIPNLAYRGANCEPTSNTVRENDVRQFPPPDLSFVDLPSYASAFRQMDVDFRVPITFESSRGCWWRHISPGCNFCAITPKSYSQRRPEEIQAYLRLAKERYGVDFVYDVSDNIGSHPGWIKQYAAATSDLDLSFKCYLSAEDGAREEVVHSLVEMNCVDAFVGYEAATKTGLRSVFKRASFKQNIRCAENLAQAGIPTVAGFIVGKEGDDEEQIRADMGLAQRMVELGNVNIVYVSMMKPVPGTALFEGLVNTNEDFRNRYGEADDIDIEELKADSIPLLSRLSWDAAKQLASEFEKLNPNRVQFRRLVARKGAPRSLLSRL